jgi:hypothetical protein
VIDLHSHVLPGLNDGVRTLEEGAEILGLAAGEGVTAIAATPHVRHDLDEVRLAVPEDTGSDNWRRFLQHAGCPCLSNGLEIAAEHASAELRDWYRTHFRPRLTRAVELGLADPGRAAALERDLKALIETEAAAQPPAAEL